jgi:aminobenzoyl-glutamate utilization protein B
MNGVRDQVLGWIDDNESMLTEISDKIWNYAELGFVEFKSSALLAKVLERFDFEVVKGVAGIPTAFVASWGSGRPSIGIMGEYDALPGLSQRAVPYREPLM